MAVAKALYNILLCAVMVLSCALTGALRKFLFQLSSEGIDGETAPFVKPWFTTLESAFACLFCGVFYFFSRGATDEDIASRIGSVPPSDVGDYHDRRRRASYASSRATPPLRFSFSSQRATPPIQGTTPPFRGTTPPIRESVASSRISFEGDATSPLIRAKTPFNKAMSVDAYLRGEYGKITWKKVLQVMVPGVLLHFSVGLLGMGLRYTSASVGNMLFGSSVIFTALISWVILKRRPNWLHWLGIGLTFLGIGVVSLSMLLMSGSSVPETESEGETVGSYSTGEATYGVVMTLIATLMFSTYLVMEEFSLQNLKLHPFQTISLEGFHGVWFTSIMLPMLVFIPGPDVGGVEENTMDTFVKLKNGGVALWVTFFLFFVVMVVSNSVSVLVTANLGSVFRAVLLNVVTAAVWFGDLATYYSGLGKMLNIGETWDKTGSPVQLVGFVVIFVGTMVYAQGSSKVVAKVEVVEALVDTVLRKSEEPPEFADITEPLLVPPPSPMAVAIPNSRTSASFFRSPAERRASLEQFAANMSGSRSIEGVLETAVEQVAIAQQWSPEITEEVATAVVDRLAPPPGRSPGTATFLNSLTSPSSWIVSDMDIDPAQHAGAGLFIQPVGPAPLPGDGLSTLQEPIDDEEAAPAFIGFNLPSEAHDSQQNSEAKN